MSTEPGLWQTVLSSAAEVVTTIFKAYVGTEPVPATIGLLFGLSWWFNRSRALKLRSTFLSDRKYEVTRSKVTAKRWTYHILLQPLYWIDDLSGLILNKPNPSSVLRAFVSFFMLFSAITFLGQVIDYTVHKAYGIPFTAAAKHGE